MKSLKNKIIALILTMIFTFSVSVTFNKGAPILAQAASEQFLSEVALIYEDSIEEAQAAVKGTDWKVYGKDLNPNNDISMFEAAGLSLCAKGGNDEAKSHADMVICSKEEGVADFVLKNFIKKIRMVAGKKVR